MARRRVTPGQGRLDLIDEAAAAAIARSRAAREKIRGLRELAPITAAAAEMVAEALKRPLADELVNLGEMLRGRLVKLHGCGCDASEWDVPLPCCPDCREKRAEAAMNAAIGRAKASATLEIYVVDTGRVIRFTCPPRRRAQRRGRR